MLGLYRTKRVTFNPKTMQLKTVDLGVEEKFIHKDNWKATKELSEPVLKNYRFETDDFGVKQAVYDDVAGRHYIETREKIIQTKSYESNQGKYGLNEKIQYFKRRVNDKALTVGQREYASKRLAKLKY